MGHKVFIALSGGVDSAVAACLLLDQGYEVHAVTMRVRAAGFKEEIACAEEVAKFLGIPHTVLDLSDEFDLQVIQPWLEAYRRGETPNPCQFCNPKVKYGALLDWAINQGADFFATGHYARLQRDEMDNVHLLQAENARKDQGYVLCRLAQEQLQRLIFPLGVFSSKAEVRALAKTRGIPVFEKKDSTGICFISKGDHLTYLSRYASSIMKPGPVRDRQGKILGRHQGLARYTIGQKKGLRAWTKDAGRTVVKLDAKENTLWLGVESDLWTKEIAVDDLRWLATLDQKRKTTVKLCQWGPKMEVSSVKPDCITLKETARAPAPGQVAAIYQDNEVVGSAVIKE